MEIFYKSLAAHSKYLYEVKPARMDKHYHNVEPDILCLQGEELCMSG